MSTYKRLEIVVTCREKNAYYDKLGRIALKFCLFAYQWLNYGEKSVSRSKCEAANRIRYDILFYFIIHTLRRSEPVFTRCASSM